MAQGNHDDNQSDSATEQTEFLCHQQDGPVVESDMKNDKPIAELEIQFETSAPDLSSVYDGLDTGWSLVVLVATFMSFVVLGGCVYTTGVVHTILLERYRQSNATTAWVASLFSALSSLAGPLSSFLIDRYSCRCAVIVSGILLTVGFVGTAFAPTIHVVIFTFGIIAGLGVGCGYIAVFTTPGFNFHRKLSMAMGLANSGAGVGIFIIGPIIEIARENYGSSGCFFILASFGIQNIVFGALMRPSTLELKTHAIKRASGSTRGSLRMYLKVCSDRCVIYLSLSLFFFSVATFAIFIHLPNFSIFNGFTSLQASFLISVSGIMTIFCKILTGIAANAEDVDEITIYVGSMWIQSFMTFMLPLYGKWYVGQVVYAAVIGLYFGCCYVLLPPINKKVVGVENMASALGIQYFLGGLGSIMGPVIAGHILDKADSYTPVFIISAIFLLLGATFGLAAVVFSSTLKTPQVKVSKSSEKEQNESETNENFLKGAEAE